MYVGNTIIFDRLKVRHWDHPHMCGEYIKRSLTSRSSDLQLLYNSFSLINYIF